MRDFHRTIVLMLIFSAVLALISRGFAQEANNRNDADAIKLKLFAFCQEGILYDRGFANTPFVGSSDDWIAKSLINDAEFIRAVGIDANRAGQISEKLGQATQVQKFDSQDREFQESHPDLAGFLLGKATVVLGEVCDRSELEKVDQARLQIEGGLYLCRPAAKVRLKLSRELHERICKAYEDAWNKAAAPIHRTAFSGAGIPPDELAIYTVQLRRHTAEVDWSVVQMLSAAEQKAFLELIQQARHLRDAVNGAGINGR